MHHGRVAPGDDGAVFQLYRCAAEDTIIPLALLALGLRCCLPGRSNNTPVFRREIKCLDKQFNPLHRLFIRKAYGIFTLVTEIAPDYFLPRGLPDHIIIGNGKTGPVYPHIRGRLVERFPAGDLLQDPFEDGEGLNITIIVHGCLIIGLQVERVDEVEVPDIGGCGLIGDVHGVLERNIPDGKGLELCISGLYSSFIVVIHLGETRGKLTTAGARPGNDHKRFVRLNIIICSVSVIADNEVHIRRITFRIVVPEDFYAPPFQLVLEQGCCRLAFETGNDNTEHIHAPALEIIDELQCIGVIGDAEISSYLFSLYIACIDAQHDICLVLEFVQESNLYIRIISGQDSGRVIVK